MFSGKATSFVGPLLYGILIGTTGNERAGMVVVILMIVGGWLVMPPLGAGTLVGGADLVTETVDRPVGTVTADVPEGPAVA